MAKRIIKIVLLLVLCALATPTIYFIAIIGFEGITHPTISLESYDKPIESHLVTAKQIGGYLLEEIERVDKLAKYELTVGAIDMKIDREHLGEVTVTFVEKNNDNSKVIFAYLDTWEGVFYKFEDYGRESKLYPGVIHLEDWMVDSTDAVRISEDFYNDNKKFRYDSIWLKTFSNYFGSVETWEVYLRDVENNVRYETSIDPYSGEVRSHSIRDFNTHVAQER